MAFSTHDDDSGISCSSSRQSTLVDEQSMPCYCGTHPGCCLSHPSIEKPNPRPSRKADALEKMESPAWATRAQRIVDNFRALFGSSKPKTSDKNIFLLDEVHGVSVVDEMEVGEPRSRLDHQPTFDPGHTLVPIHPNVRCHISLDHLDCVRRRRGLKHGTRPVFIEELSSREPDTEFSGNDWSSELYYYNGSFLQRQQIRLNVKRPARYCIRIKGCIHTSIDVAPCIPSFSSTLKACITTHPPRCPAHASEICSNVDGGKHTQLVCCDICQSVTECEVTLERDYTGRAVKLRFTSYKDLGSGIKEEVVT